VPAAEIKRTVLQKIPDVEDRERHVSLIEWPDHPEFGKFLEIADYVPSRDLYGRGYTFPVAFGPKVVAGIRAAKAAS
jgi:hypothetical protein